MFHQNFVKLTGIIPFSGGAWQIGTIIARNIVGMTLSSAYGHNCLASRGAEQVSVGGMGENSDKRHETERSLTTKSCGWSHSHRSPHVELRDLFATIKRIGPGEV